MLCPFPIGFGIDALEARCVDEEKELRCIAYLETLYSAEIMSHG
jgi:hypothetical protein